MGAMVTDTTYQRMMLLHTVDVEFICCDPLVIVKYQGDVGVENLRWHLFCKERVVYTRELMISITYKD